MIRSFLVVLGALGILPQLGWAADAEFSGSARIVLCDAVFQKDKSSPGERRSIIFEGEAENGRWDRLGGMALGYNNGDHYGYVQECSVATDSMTMKLLVTIGRDVWIPGGEAVYTVKFTRKGDHLEGTYEGACNGVPVSGKAAGLLGPPKPIRVRDYKPLDPTEHPRLLFRKHQLPVLRERLKTPLGQAYLAAATGAIAGDDKKKVKGGDLVSCGMLYQLTGEKSYADKAQKIIEGFDHNLSPEGGAGSGGVGHQLVAIALAYDLCYEAWPNDFRSVLTQDLDREVSFMQRSLIAGGNFHPCSNFYGPGRGAPAIASLALFGEKGPAPKKPAAPDEILAKGDLQAKLWAKSGQLDKYKAEYPKMMARYQADLLAWERTGGADLAKLETFHAGYIQMNRHYRFGIGDGGYGAETHAYADIASFYPLCYNTYYMTMFGKEATFRPDVALLPVRRMMQTIFLPGGKLREESIGPVGGWKTAFVAAAWPAIPEQYKPAVLWGWNSMCEVNPDDPRTLGNLFSRLDWGTGGLPLAHIFLHYPLDMKPVHPSQGMPNNWEARGFGWYCFRNGWEGKDAIMAQVYLKSMPVGGWNLPAAGTFRLSGLGHVWVGGNHSKEAYRFEEGVLLLPEDKVNTRACAHPAQVAFSKDGSGTLTADMNDLYGTTKEVPNPRTRKPIVNGGIVIDRSKKADDTPDMAPSRLYDRNGIRFQENWADSGVTGLRAFGFDYSKKSGAPLLMVIVDKVEGGKKRDWNWPYPGEDHGRQSASPTAKADGNSFTLSYGDGASLKATFVSPGKVTIDPAAKVRIDFERWQGKFVEYNRISTTAESGSFFVIITLQNGEAPAIKVEGSGLGAKVKVGEQTVRFDGEKVVFGE